MLHMTGLLSSKSPDNIAEEDVEEIEALRKKMFTSASSSNSTRRLGQRQLASAIKLHNPIFITKLFHSITSAYFPHKLQCLLILLSGSDL